MIKAVVFDLDDTLAPELDFAKSGYGAVARYLVENHCVKADVQSVYEELWALFSTDSKNVFNRLLEAHNISYEKDDILKLIKIYREHEIDTTIYKEYGDVSRTLASLKDKGCHLGILSDGFLVSQQHKIKALGYDKNTCFDEIVLTDALGREFWKPSEKGFLMLCEAFKVCPEEMLYVGDNPNKDFMVKKNIAIKTARIIRENGVYSKAEYKENIREDYSLSGLEDVCELWGL